MTHGSGDGMTLGITGATGADGTTRSTTGDSGDGTTLGTTVATGGIIHGIRTMPDGTEDGTTHIGDITIITTDRDMAQVTSLTTTTDRASTQAPDTAQVPTGCLHEAVRSEVAVR